MASKVNKRKDEVAYSLWNNGCFTWNKRSQQLIFMRAGSRDSERDEMRYPSSFYVEGEDIKRLYQVLHEHYLSPASLGGGNHTRTWEKDLPHPPSTTRGANLCED
jgi:hypothetical protein